MVNAANEEALYVLDDYVSEEELGDLKAKDARLKSGVSTTSFSMLDKCVEYEIFVLLMTRATH